LIFVTVGTNPDMGFDRLVRPMDELAAELQELVIIQRGCSAYEPRFAEHFRFSTGDEIEQLNREARVVVSHAAAGAIVVALKYRKPLVLMARLQKFNEVIDDHQLQLAGALEAQGKAVVVHDAEAYSLRHAIEQATRLRYIAGEESETPRTLVEAMRRYLVELVPKSY
jgi:beta-1,4-N-acetylglucosaminyltransferase